MQQLEQNQDNRFTMMFNKIKASKESTIFLILLLFIVFVALNSPVFLSVNNIRTTAMGLSTNGLVAIGVTIALIGGCFDLSVGAHLGLSAVITVVLSLRGLNPWLASLVAFIISLFIGSITGVLVGRFRLNGFITTFAVSQIARGVVLVLTKGYSLGLPTRNSTFQNFGNSRLFGIPVIVILFVVVAVIAHFLVKRSSLLRKVFYVGSNESAAILSGINSSKVKIGLYTLTASLGALAGILTVARFGVATATNGEGVEMLCLSAAVIGGTSLAGGQGTILGTVLGIVLLSIINNALVLFRISVYWQSLIAGAILLVAILIDFFSKRNNGD